MTDTKKPTELSDVDLDAVRGAGDPIPTETLSLNYQEVQYDYATLRPKLTQTDGIRAPGKRAGIRAGKRALKS
jgi:type VI protein secretion system component Hcp